MKQICVQTIACRNKQTKKNNLLIIIIIIIIIMPVFVQVKTLNKMDAQRKLCMYSLIIGVSVYKAKKNIFFKVHLII